MGDSGYIPNIGDTMKTIETVCYKTPDGQLFDDEENANKHYDDLIGEELDGLMRLSKINMTRTDEFKLIVGWINQPDELKKAINAIHKIINFNGE